MVEKYKRGNPYAKLPALTDVAVDWQGLTLMQQDAVILNADGLPELEGCPELLERAEALLEAVRHNLVTGNWYDPEYDRNIEPQYIKLDRASAEAWIAKTELRLTQVAPAEAVLPQPRVAAERLYTLEEVMSLVGKSKSTLERWIAEGKFPESSHFEPQRWSAAALTPNLARDAMRLTTKVIAKAAKGKLAPPAAPGPEHDDI